MAKYLRAEFMLSPAAVKQLAELRVDELGGVEHGDEAHEIARQHAVEQQVHLIGRQLDAGLGQRAGDLRLGLGDLVLVLDDALLGILDVAIEARHGVVEHARQHGVLGRRDLLFLQRGDVGFDLADVLAQALDLLLHVDDRHVGDDAKGRVEQIADARLAVLARFRPQRGEDELVAAGQLLRLRALLGGVLQDGIDGEHELARLLVGGFALARILRLDGARGLRRRRRRRANYGRDRLGGWQRRLGKLFGLAGGCRFGNQLGNAIAVRALSTGRNR